MRVSLTRFEQAVSTALDSVPVQFQPYLENIEFLIAESSPEGLLGLYEGATALSDDWPDRITIFKRAHEETAQSWQDLVAEVRRTILHEIGHHFGMEEDELPY